MAKRKTQRLSATAQQKYDETFSAFVPANEMQQELAYQFCESWEIYTRCRNQYKKEGLIIAAPNGVMQPNPTITIMNKQLDQMRKHYLILCKEQMIQVENDGILA